MNIKDFKNKPIMGILRGATADVIEPLVETVVAAGLETLEITMNTPGAAQLISQAAKAGKNKLALGAGTVLNLSDLQLALKSGATFIVMPVLVEDVVDYCVKNYIPVFPGAFSPQEIYRAHQCGAAMVKVFPAKTLGPQYFREIKGPFADIPLLACGGINPENLAEYFDCGASGVTFGASIFKTRWLEEKKFEAIGIEIKRFILAWEKVRA